MDLIYLTPEDQGAASIMDLDGDGYVYQGRIHIVSATGRRQKTSAGVR